MKKSQRPLLCATCPLLSTFVAASRELQRQCSAAQPLGICPAVAKKSAGQRQRGMDSAFMRILSKIESGEVHSMFLSY